MAKQKYTVESFVRSSGTQTAFSALSDAEQNAVRSKLTAQAAEALSRYLSEHPDELKPFLSSKKPERDCSGLSFN